MSDLFESSSLVLEDDKCLIIWFVFYYSVPLYICLCLCISNMFKKTPCKGHSSQAFHNKHHVTTVKHLKYTSVGVCVCMGFTVSSC